MTTIKEVNQAISTYGFVLKRTKWTWAFAPKEPNPKMQEIIDIVSWGKEYALSNLTPLADRKLSEFTTIAIRLNEEVEKWMLEHPSPEKFTVSLDDYQTTPTICPYCGCTEEITVHYTTTNHRWECFNCNGVWVEVFEDGKLWGLVDNKCNVHTFDPEAE